MPYTDAVTALFRAPLDQFIVERKRLSGELKAAGDAEGAGRLAKIPRPPLSAWAVNRLYQDARASFDALFAAAARLREGDVDASPAHREALAKLRERAGALLTEAGHAATEATLRRVTQTLSALAAAGTWDPDPPGALHADRDPPGFEVTFAGDATPQHHDAAAPAAHDDGAEKHRREAEEKAAREAEAAERRRLEEERAKRAAERRRVESALHAARAAVTAGEREVAKLEKDLTTARDSLDASKTEVASLEAKLARLEG